MDAALQCIFVCSAKYLSLLFRAVESAASGCAAAQTPAARGMVLCDRVTAHGSNRARRSVRWPCGRAAVWLRTGGERARCDVGRPCGCARAANAQISAMSSYADMI